MPPRLRRRVDALRVMTVPDGWASTGPTIDPGILTTVAQTCWDEQRLQFSYTARGGEQTARHVEPHRLASLGRRWCLVAYDLTRHEWRSFRLDRLDESRSTGARFRPQELPADNAATFVRAGIGNLPAQYAVEVLVHTPAVTVRDQVGRWGTVEDVDNGDACCG
ncbi:MAG: helix-turn-helix transcriptional regulator [Pseudonocardiaceae bacterium]